MKYILYLHHGLTTSSGGRDRQGERRGCRRDREAQVKEPRTTEYVVLYLRFDI